MWLLRVSCKGARPARRLQWFKQTTKRLNSIRSHQNCYWPKAHFSMCTETNTMGLAFEKRKGFICESTGMETRGKAPMCLPEPGLQMEFLRSFNSGSSWTTEGSGIQVLVMSQHFGSMGGAIRVHKCYSWVMFTVLLISGVYPRFKFWFPSCQKQDRTSLSWFCGYKTN